MSQMKKECRFAIRNNCGFIYVRVPIHNKGDSVLFEHVDVFTGLNPSFIVSMFHEKELCVYEVVVCA